MGKVVTFGEIMLRLSPNNYERLFQSDTLKATFGGAEANVAVSLANYGVESRFVSKLPNSPVGEAAIRELRAFNVDTSYILRGGERVGIYYLEKGASQRASVCLYDRAHSSIAEASSDEFHWDEIFEGASWFHFTGITPALSDGLYVACQKACQIARSKGITISCDLNYRSKLWTKQLARERMSELCKYVDVCIANEEDAKNVFDICPANTDVTSGVLNKQAYIDVASQLICRFGFKAVAFTLRSSMSANDNKWAGMIYDGSQAYYSKEYDIHIVDRVGGGDSFGAGIIYSMLNKKNYQEAIDFAVAASALKHSIEGDYNRVSIVEIEHLLGGDGSGRIQR